MEQSDFERLAVIATCHGQKYLGLVVDQSEGARAHVEKAHREKTPIRLSEARLLISEAGLQQGRGGMGVSVFVTLVPIDFNIGPVNITLGEFAEWYFPAENEASRTAIEKLISDAANMETGMRAQRAGIQVPKLVRDDTRGA